MSVRGGDGGRRSSVIVWMLCRTLFNVIVTSPTSLFNFLLSWMTEGDVG